MQYDYIGVLYPEGFLNIGTMALFNDEQIESISFRGYENIERQNFIRELHGNSDFAASEQPLTTGAFNG